MINSGGSASRSTSGRQLSVAGWILLVAVYLIVLQGLTWFLTRGLDATYAAPRSIDELWRQITVPVVASVLLVGLLISYLGWWRPVTVDERPVRRWVMVVPIVMVVTIAVVTSYGELAAKGAAFSLLLLLSSLCVGFGEELMFRGVGVTTFRSNGFSEGKVALWTTVVFGLAHATNLLTAGPAALAQVLATILAGYLLYLIRRRSGGILAGALIHGLWDFSLITNLVGDEPGLKTTISVVVMIVLAAVLLVRRRHIEPQPAAAIPGP